MTNVDPFLIPIPRAFLVDPEVRQYMEYKDRVIHDLYLRTGGADDAVEVATNRDVYDGTSWAAIANKFNDEIQSIKAELSYAQIQKIEDGLGRIKGELLYLDLPADTKLNPVTVNGGTYEAVPGDFINAKSRALIKFPSSGMIEVRNGDGSVISLDGNGKLINGKSTGKLYNKGTSIQFYHFVEDDEWFAR